MTRRATVDTTEAQSFEAVEPGPYQMNVDEIEDPAVSQGKSGATGMWIYFKFQDPNVAKKAGRVRKWYALDGGGSGFFREFWKAATGEDIPMGTTIDVDLDDAPGRPVVVLIGNETYEGRLQNTVERVSAAA